MPARRSTLDPLRPTLVAAALALACAFAATSAGAALYKWTDANGRVVYSDVPPSGDVKSERMATPAPAANPNAAKEMVNQDAELKKRQMQRAEDSAKAEKAKADATRRQEACTQLRAQVLGLQNSNVVHYRFNERGDRVILDDMSRRKEIDRLEGLARTQCTGA